MSARRASAAHELVDAWRARRGYRERRDGGRIRNGLGH